MLPHASQLSPIKIRSTHHYRIPVEGFLSSGRSEWFAGTTVAQTKAGDTFLLGRVVDQAAQRGLLAKIRGLHLAWVAVERVEPGQPDRART